MPSRNKEASQTIHWKYANLVALATVLSVGRISESIKYFLFNSTKSLPGGWLIDTSFLYVTTGLRKVEWRQKTETMFICDWEEVHSSQWRATTKVYLSSSFTVTQWLDWDTSLSSHVTQIAMKGDAGIGWHTCCGLNMKISYPRTKTQTLRNKSSLFYL